MSEITTTMFANLDVSVEADFIPFLDISATASTGVENVNAQTNSQTVTVGTAATQSTQQSSQTRTGSVNTETTDVSLTVARPVPGCAQLHVQFVVTDYTGSVDFQATLAPQSNGSTADQLRDCIYTVQGSWHGANQLDTRIVTSLATNPSLSGACLLPRPPPAPSNAPYTVDATGHRRPDGSALSAEEGGSKDDSSGTVIAIGAVAGVVVIVAAAAVLFLYCKRKASKAPPAGPTVVGVAMSGSVTTREVESTISTTEEEKSPLTPQRKSELASKA